MMRRENQQSRGSKQFFFFFRGCEPAKRDAAAHAIHVCSSLKRRDVIGITFSRELEYHAWICAANEQPRIEKRFEILDWIDSSQKQNRASVIVVVVSCLSWLLGQRGRRNDIRTAREIDAMPIGFAALGLAREMQRRRSAKIP